MTRWNGSLIGVQKNTSLTDSTGVWNLRKQTLAKQNAVWPLDNSTIPQPNWSLDFSSGEPWSNNTDYTFVSTASTTRTFVNSSGYVAPCVANLVQQSQAFDNAYWTKSGLLAFGSGSTVDAAAAPDGTTTADLITETSGGTVHGILRGVGAYDANTSYALSIYVKKPTSNAQNFITLTFSGTVGHRLVRTFNMTDGTSTENNFTGTNFVARTHSATDVGSGWWRFMLSVTIGGTQVGADAIYISLSNSATPTLDAGQRPNYSGDGVSGLLIWGAQYVTGTAALPYSATTTSSNGIPRLTHNSSGSRLGLLVEGQRTNLSLQSKTIANWLLLNTTRTANSTTSPDNTTNASRFVETSATGSHQVYMTNGSQPTATVLSVYAKKDQRDCVTLNLYAGANIWMACTFDLTNGTAGTMQFGSSSTWTSTEAVIENAGNGWYRCQIRGQRTTGTETVPVFGLATSATPTLASTSGVENYAGNTANGLFLWGAQWENVNSRASSLIETTTTTVTRNEDKVHITKSKITNWSSPGAICVHFYKPLQAGTLVSTDDATAEQLGIQAATTSTARAFWSNGQTATGDIGEPVVQKAVHYWDGTTSKFCINGTTVQTGTNNVSNFNNTNFITLGAEATDSSGSPGTFSNYANCVIRKVEFYAGQLTDTNLQEITNIGNYTSQYVVVAGGAGGGYGGGGGGGAGGYLESSSYLLVPGLTYSVTVGSGGVGGTNSASATNGNNSSFGSISTVGGGLGGRSVNSGGSGGSGGGGGGWGNGATTAGTGTAGQGNAGGNNGYPNTHGYPWASGGGGGAGSAGTAPPIIGTGGSGGNGIAFSITGTSVTRAGGGGGGVTEQGGIAGAAGSGGGGSGGTPNVAPGAGSANTGGGGGGGAGVTANLNGAAGGSGVVIIRVPTSNYSGVYTGSPNISQVGDDTVLVFNSSGSYRA